MSQTQTHDGTLQPDAHGPTRPPGKVFVVTVGCAWPARPPGKVLVVAAGCAWPTRPPGKFFVVTVGCTWRPRMRSEVARWARAPQG